jgi:hypothetical protein
MYLRDVSRSGRERTLARALRNDARLPAYAAAMSVDMAVWEGERPGSDDEAVQTFERLYEQYIETSDAAEPSPKIREFVESLLETFPDLDALGDDEVDDSPWSDNPASRQCKRPVHLLRNGHERCRSARVGARAKYRYSARTGRIRSPVGPTRLGITLSCASRSAVPPVEVLRRGRLRLAP